MTGDQTRMALTILAKMVLHTGKELDHLTAEDFLELHAWSVRETWPQDDRPARSVGSGARCRRAGRRPSAAGTLRAGQRSTAELVDQHWIACQPIREVLIRYLGQRRPALDYSSFRQVARALAGRFWADIERHHPAIDTLALPAAVADAWKQRLLHVQRDGQTRVRQGRLDILARVSSVYFDMQEWGSRTPLRLRGGCRAPFAAVILRDSPRSAGRSRPRCPGVRDRLPQLPLLVDVAEQHRDDVARLLASVGQAASVAWLITTGTPTEGWTHATGPAVVVAENLTTGETIELVRAEDDAFWAWAIIETLRHTGVRRESCWRSPTSRWSPTGSPQPGRSSRCYRSCRPRFTRNGCCWSLRNLPASWPRSSAASAARRQVPLVARYDPHERTTGPALPHLFQRRTSWPHQVISPPKLISLLNQTIQRTGMTDRDRPTAALHTP